MSTVERKIRARPQPEIKPFFELPVDDVSSSSRLPPASRKAIATHRTRRITLRVDRPAVPRADPLVRSLRRTADRARIGWTTRSAHFLRPAALAAASKNGLISG